MRLATFFALTLLLFSFVSPAASEERPDERFRVEDNVIVADAETGLMWALQDNGRDVDWWEAKKYCEDFKAGGYDDWRLPGIKELATLYTHNKTNQDGYAIPEAFKLSSCCIWSSYDTMGGSLVFNYKSGNKSPHYLADKFQLRALPVRGKSKIDLKKYKTFVKDK